MTIDVFYNDLSVIFDLFFPTTFTLFERLLLLGTFFGVFVFLIRKLKGE